MGKPGLALVGRAMLSKSLVQLSADRWDCDPSLLVVDLRQPSPEVYRLFGRANGKLQEDLGQHAPPRTAAASVPVPMTGHC